MLTPSPASCVAGIPAALAAVALLRLTNPTAALENTLGHTPGMGWNSDYCIGCVLPPLSSSSSSGLDLGSDDDGHRHLQLGGIENEAFVKLIADTMHSMPVATAGGKTLQQLGYK